MELWKGIEGEVDSVKGYIITYLSVIEDEDVVWLFVFVSGTLVTESHHGTHDE